MTKPRPPKDCICASFWTIRGKHKSDCPLNKPLPSVIDRDLEHILITLTSGLSTSQLPPKFRVSSTSSRLMEAKQQIQALIDKAVVAELENIIKGTRNPEQAGVKTQHRLIELKDQLSQTKGKNNGG